MNTPRNTFTKTTLAWTFCLLTVVSAFTFLAPRQAEAQATGAACAVGGYLAGKIAGLIGSAVSLEVPVAPTQLNTKAFTLDRLASCAAKEILHQMTLSTINWINSGFNGSPSFLTNPKGFFLDAADQVTGVYLSDNGPLNNLCSPWSVDVRLALAFGQSGTVNGRSRYACTLGTIINNAKNASYSVEGFVQGDFSQGGWDAFVAQQTEPQNNAYGAYLEANSNLLAAIGRKQSGLSKALTEGQGFLSKRACKTVSMDDTTYKPPADWENATITSNEDGTFQECVTQTPGSFIAHTLNTHSDAGIVEAEMANDINSVVNVLMTQLTSQLLSKGLNALGASGSGVSGGGYSSSDSYISQVRQDVTAGQVASTYSQAVNLITASQASYQSAKACFSNKLAVAQPGSISSSTQATIQASISRIDSTLTGNVIPLLNSLNIKLTAAQTQGSGITSATAAADASNARAQSAAFDADATAYKNTCDSLQ